MTELISLLSHSAVKRIAEDDANGGKDATLNNQFKRMMKLSMMVPKVKSSILENLLSQPSSRSREGKKNRRRKNYKELKKAPIQVVNEQSDEKRTMKEDDEEEEEIDVVNLPGDIKNEPDKPKFPVSQLLYHHRPNSTPCVPDNNTVSFIKGRCKSFDLNKPTTSLTSSSSCTSSAMIPNLLAANFNVFCSVDLPLCCQLSALRKHPVPRIKPTLSTETILSNDSSLLKGGLEVSTLSQSNTTVSSAHFHRIGDLSVYNHVIVRLGTRTAHQVNRSAKLCLREILSTFLSDEEALHKLGLQKDEVSECMVNSWPALLAVNLKKDDLILSTFERYCRSTPSPSSSVSSTNASQCAPNFAFLSQLNAALSSFHRLPLTTPHRVYINWLFLNINRFHLQNRKEFCHALAFCNFLEELECFEELRECLCFFQGLSHSMLQALVFQEEADDKLCVEQFLAKASNNILNFKEQD